MNDCSICKNYEPVTAKMAGQKTAKGNPDVVQVVRCKDCKYLGIKFAYGYCENVSGLHGIVRPESYCSRGERKEVYGWR